MVAAVDVDVDDGRADDPEGLGDDRSSAATDGASSSWLAAFLIAFVALAVWSLALAPWGGPDEPAHARKAVAVAQGDLTTEVRRVVDGFGLDQPLTDLMIPSAWAFMVDACVITDEPSSCAPRPSRERGEAAKTTTYVGAYPPVYYAPVGLPALAFAPDPALPLMRLVSSAMAAALLASAWVSLRRIGGGVFSLAGLVLSVPPAAALIAGSVNASGVELAAAVALWAAALEVLVSGSRAPGPAGWARLAVAAAVLAWTRPLGPLFSLGILGLVAVTAGWPSVRDRLADRTGRPWLIGLSLLVAGAGAFVAVNGSIGAVMLGPEGGPPAADQARDAAADTLDWWVSAIGEMGWVGPRSTELPGWATAAWLLVGAALAVAAVVRSDNRARLLLVAIVAAAVLLPVIGVLRSPRVAWQGRYALPILSGLPIVAGLFVDRAVARSRAGADVVVRALGTVAVAVPAIVAFIAVQVVQSRQSEGAGRPIFAALTSTEVIGWAPPLALSVAAALVTITLIAAATRLTPRSSSERGPSKMKRPATAR